MGSIGIKINISTHSRIKTFVQLMEVTLLTVATRREREQQLRRETIMDAARKLFHDKGYEPTTVEEIAVMAELGKGTIYSYFKSKDEIYIAILESEFAILENRMKQAIHDSTTAENALLKLYETFIQYNEERPSFIKAIFLQINQYPSLKVTDIVKGLKAKTTQWAKLVGEVLQKGIDNGEFEIIDVEKIANTVIGMVLGLIVQLEMGLIQEDLSSYRDTLFHLLIQGISKRQSHLNIYFGCGFLPWSEKMQTFRCGRPDHIIRIYPHGDNIIGA